MAAWRLFTRSAIAEAKAAELAPWAVTVMAQGGLGIAAFPERGAHVQSLLPTNPLVMWALHRLLG